MHLLKKKNYLDISLYTFFMMLPISIAAGNFFLNFNIFLILSFFLSFVIINKIKVDKTYLIFILLFFIYSIINSVLINFSLTALWKSIAYLRYLFLPLAISIFFQLTKINKKYLFLFYISFVMFLSFDIFYQYIFYEDIFGFDPGMCADENRPLKLCVRFSGFFGEELIGGSFISLFGPLSVFLYLSGGELNNKKVIISTLCLLIMFFAILISGERSGLLYFLLFNFVFFYFLIFKILKNKKKFFILIFIIPFFIIFLMTKFSSTVNQRLVNYPMYLLTKAECGMSFEKTTIKKIKTCFKGLNYKDIIKNSLDTSWGHHYLSAYEIFKSNPIFGTGIKSFRHECKNYDFKFLEDKYKFISSFHTKSVCSTHPHNYHVQIFAEMGLFGYIFFAVFILYLLKKGFYNFNLKNHSTSENLLIYASLSAIIAFIFPLKPTGDFFSTSFGFWFWFILGIYLYSFKNNHHGVRKAYNL